MIDNNKMATKKEKTKNGLQTLHRQLNIEQLESHYKLKCTGRVCSFCSTSDTRRLFYS